MKPKRRQAAGKVRRIVLKIGWTNLSKRIVMPMMSHPKSAYVGAVVAEVRTRWHPSRVRLVLEVLPSKRKAKP